MHEYATRAHSINTEESGFFVKKSIIIVHFAFDVIEHFIHH